MSPLDVSKQAHEDATAVEASSSTKPTVEMPALSRERPTGRTALRDVERTQFSVLELQHLREID
jgi:hypothetical protein